MKQAVVNLPHGARFLILPKKEKANNGQQDAFKKYREAWLEMMLAHIEQKTGEVRMSDIRVEANVLKLAAPIDQNWWGTITKKMKPRGWYLVRYEMSPIKSRKGNPEGVWQRRAA